MIQELARWLGGADGALILCLAAGLLMAFMGQVALAMKKRDRIDSLLMAFFLMELSAAFIFLTFGFDDSEAESSPRLVPLLWGGALLVCSTMQFFRIWTKKNYKPVAYGHLGKVALVVAVVAAAIACFNLLGFFISTGAMLVALMFLMGERRPLLMGGTAIIWMVATWAIFNKLLLLGLPIGSLFN